MKATYLTIYFTAHIILSMYVFSMYIYVYESSYAMRIYGDELLTCMYVCMWSRWSLHTAPFCDLHYEAHYLLRLREPIGMLQPRIDRAGSVQGHRGQLVVLGRGESHQLRAHGHRPSHAIAPTAHIAHLKKKKE